MNHVSSQHRIDNKYIFKELIIQYTSLYNLFNNFLTQELLYQITDIFLGLLICLQIALHKCSSNLLTYSWQKLTFHLKHDSPKSCPPNIPVSSHVQPIPWVSTSCSLEVGNMIIRLALAKVRWTKVIRVYFWLEAKDTVWSGRSRSQLWHRACKALDGGALEALVLE